MTKDERLEIIDRMIKVWEVTKGGKFPNIDLSGQSPNGLIRAAIGVYAKPEDDVKEAFALYLSEIAVQDQLGKSEAQLAAWKKVKNRAVKNFLAIVGNPPILKITRDDARKFHQHWQRRVAAKEVGYSAANRDLGNMRLLFASYVDRLGLDLKNPFEGLSFQKPKGRTRRVPFTVEGLQALIAPGALESMNDEARRALMVMIETGCRPSEILNLDPSNICLDAKVPHIKIRHRDGREVKTESSERDIPLVGIALAAMRKQPGGFPRYVDGENSYSQAVLKYLRRKKLVPNGEVVYSIRHSFEDRMKAAGFDSEMRMALFGHKSDRPEYGDGYTLEVTQAAMQRIALPFQDEVV